MSEYAGTCLSSVYPSLNYLSCWTLADQPPAVSWEGQDMGARLDHLQDDIFQALQILKKLHWRVSNENVKKVVLSG